MALRMTGRALFTRERNTELVLLAGCVAFILLAWRSLDAAAFELPDGSRRIVTQFLAVALLGHAGLRVVAPRAAAQPYATAMLLAAVGLAFVTRLAPGVAQDQANWLTLGVALMLAATVVGRRYGLLRGFTYTSAAAAVALLVATGLFGTTLNGARLWIEVGGQSVQTTEVIKLLMLVFLAGYLASEGDVLSASTMRFAGRTYRAAPYLLPLAAAFLVAIGALALLKDLGTIALLLLLGVAALYVATGRLRFVVGGAAVLAITAALGYLAFDHVHERIDTWRDPFAHADDAGFQTTQSLYALEAGGVTGEGLGLGHPDVIPAAPTDYVFSAIGEELGLAGAFGVVLLYALFVFAGLQVALGVRDEFGRLLASGIALLIGIQATVIIAGNLRLIPTTGITLPFVSYGGSSLVVNFVLVGLLLGISHAERESAQA